MLKRLMPLLFLLLLPPFSGLGEETPVYEAYARVEFHMRQEPGSNLWSGKVEAGAIVRVYEYGDSWCRIGCRNEQGWCQSGWLWGFRSLDALNFPVPGALVNQGAVQLAQDTWIQGGKFEGVMARAGAIVCISERTGVGYRLPVWRGEDLIPLESGNLVGFDIWEEAAPGQLLGGFTTFYGDQLGKGLSKERAYNIALGCKRIHGTILEAGERFSFNALCGPYQQENGYLLAPNISKDGKGYGGGVCQVSTTLYNALLGLPLQIEEWAVHRFSGIDYAPQFFDAAVGTYTDLAFINTMPSPIRISALDQAGIVTVLIHREGEGIEN